MGKKQMIYGFHPVEEALKTGKALDRIFASNTLNPKTQAELHKLSRTHNVGVHYVPAPKLKRLSPGNHQGIIGFISPVEFVPLESFIQGLFESGKTPLLAVLDGVTDVRNFGAICRSVECMGGHAIVIPLKGSAPVQEDAMKTSAGALLHLPIIKVKSLKECITYLNNSGLQTLAFSEKSTQALNEIDLKLPTAMIFGNEDKGVSHSIAELSSQQVKIPMQGVTDSLNVSVSVGIAMYEVSHQRNHK
jgi:23S rRNA (guanosine2251-2'-O)-methyltransferase